MEDSVRNQTGPDQPANQQPQITVVNKDSLLGKTVMGVFCASLVAIVMNFAGLKWLVIHLFALFLSLFGKDVYEVKPTDAVKESAKVYLKKHDIKGMAGEVIKGYQGEVKGDVRKAVVGAVASKVGARFGIKTPRQIESERQQQLSRDRDQADTLGIRWGEDWDHQRFLDELKKAREAADLARKREAESAERNALTDQATAIHYGVNPSWDLPVMRQQVKLAQESVNSDAAYQLKRQLWEQAMREHEERLATGPNSVCPACRFTLRLPDQHPTYKAYCPRCRFIAQRRVFFQGFRPPPAPKEPEPPPVNAGLLGTFFK